MEKNSEFIRTKEFHVVFKGYNPEEVDKFLDIVSVEFERLIKKNRELQESLDKVKFESTEEEDTDIKKIIQDALISAHKVADEIKNKAKTEAEEMVESIKLQQEQSMSELEQKKANLEESINSLQTKYYEFKNRISEELKDIGKFIDTAEDAHILESGKDIQQEPAPEEEAENENILPLQDEISADTPEKHTGQDQEPEELQAEEQAEEIIYQEEEKEAENTRGSLSQLDPFDANARISEEKNEKLSENGLKRERKKIDIANPDIIENFFRANNE